MKGIIHIISAVMIIGLLIGGVTVCSKIDAESEKAVIKEVIHNSIGWAKTKDKDLSYSCFAQDSNLFFFNPDPNNTVGFDALKQLTETVFMNDAFKAIRYDIRDLEINLSRSGDVAWYRAMLDDINEWNGQPACWINVRWTGVLEKRDGRWVIVQMHFSYAREN